MKIKKKNLVKLWNLFSELLNTKENFKFTYAVFKNRKLIENEVKAIWEAEKPGEKYIEYTDSYNQLLAKYATKDENGDILFSDENSMMVPIVEERDKFYSVLNDLNEKYRDVIKERQSQIKAIEEIVEEEVEINFYMVEKDFLPGQISLAMLEVLEPVIMDA